MKLGPYDLNSIVTGYARELAKAIPDESIDLIFTDPVYDRIEDYEWLAKTAARVLKPGGNLLTYTAHHYQMIIGAVMLKYLQPRPILTTWMSPPYPRFWAYNLHVNYSFVIWFAKNGGKPDKWIIGELGQSFQNKNFSFKWGKNLGAIAYYIEKFVNPDALIFDPFVGGGTVPAVCKMLNRNYLAFEIDPATADLARQRVLLTQPPLPMEIPRQADFDFSTKV